MGGFLELRSHPEADKTMKAVFEASGRVKLDLSAEEIQHRMAGREGPARLHFRRPFRPHETSKL